MMELHNFFPGMFYSSVLFVCFLLTNLSAQNINLSSQFVRAHNPMVHSLSLLTPNKISESLFHRRLILCSTSIISIIPANYIIL